MEDLFLARDEIIDIKDDIFDFWPQDTDHKQIKESVLRRLDNTLDLIEAFRIEHNIPDRDYIPDI